MSQRKTIVACFPVLFFVITFCRGLKVTGEICGYSNEVLECKSEIISHLEKRKLLDTYGDKKCVLETYINELQIEDDLCFPKSEVVSKPFDILQGIKKTSEIIEDTISSGKSEWADEDFESIFDIDARSAMEDYEVIEFHPRAAKNVIISSDHKNAYRKFSPSTGFGSALTKEPLKPGQIFSVWVNYKTVEDFPFLGVTRYSPESIIYPEQMLQMSDGTWTWDTLANEIYKDGDSLVKDFVQEDLNIQNGDRFGVSISGEGQIHFHHNGRDLGSTEESVEEEMWGFVDINWPGTNATLVS